MKKLILFALFSGFIFACSSGSDGGSSTDNFDRKAMLTDWADHIIIPAYTDYQAKAGTLSQDAAAFSQAPTATTLATLRTSWLNAYKAWQHVGMFVIGKSEDVSLKEFSNTYPADATGIESNISNGNYNLTLFAQFDKQGFPAIDYLINGLGDDDNSILTRYTTDTNSAKTRQYLTDLTARLKANVDLVVADWNGGYRDTFVNNDGSGVSSSVSKMTNLFVKYLERDVRSGKVGIPAGTLSNGTTFPEKTEGYYKNDVSKVLLQEAMSASNDFFNGKYFDGTATGNSFKQYLDYLKSVRDGQNLSTVINAQYTASDTAIAALNNSFSQQVFSNNAGMIAAYNQIQQLVVYTKLDMMQALNITVDYVDGDGD